MTTTDREIQKAARKQADPPAAPMSAEEAEASLDKIKRLGREWVVELYTFNLRRGFAALGYTSLAAAVSDRLGISVSSALHAVAAAGIKHQLAATSQDPEEKKRILSLSDQAAQRLKRVDPGRRLTVFREAAATAGTNGGRVSAQLLGACSRRMLGVHPKLVRPADRQKCPRCEGRGWVER